MPVMMYIWGDNTDAFNSGKTKDETLDDTRKNAILFIIVGSISLVLFCF